MLESPIDAELERALAAAAARAGEAPGELARRALLAYLEDLEDYAAAAEAWSGSRAASMAKAAHLPTRASFPVERR